MGNSSELRAGEFETVEIRIVKSVIARIKLIRLS